MFTGASETLRLSGIEADVNASGRYQAVRPRALAIDRAAQADEIRRLLASPDVIVGSVAAVTETGSLVTASASGSQLPGYAGGAARAIWVVGAQKVVPDLSAALRRVEEHGLPLENARARRPTGSQAPSTALLILNANTSRGAAPCCCSARPSGSETGAVRVMMEGRQREEGDPMASNQPRTPPEETAPVSPAGRLRRLIEEGELVVAPGIFDGLSAHLVRRMGFLPGT